MENPEFNNLLMERMKKFAIRSMKFVQALPFNTVTKVLGDQYLKSSTSGPANHRAFCRGRSKNEKFAKICIVVEELDEAGYWLDLFIESRYGDKEEVVYLKQEGTELLLISPSIKNGFYPK